METKRIKVIRKHTDLEVYRHAFDAAMRVFELSRKFPAEERYSLTDQGRRSSRSVCANVAEAWRKRRYAAAFVSKLSDSEGEAAETQVWIQFAVACGYLDRESGRALYSDYDKIIGMLVTMIKRPTEWTLS
ncbi:MAG: four helix bundle protein [Opitutaceae bacterium]|nr:four helix bundle protein [Opitutaceae bacterium]